MVTPGSPGTGGTHRCRRASRCCADANHASSKCSSRRILPTAFSATLGQIERDRAEIAGAVQHGDRYRRIVVGKRGGREGKPRMVVMMWHADQRHGFGKAELPGENLRRPRHLIETAAVEGRCILEAQQFQALRNFLHQRARYGASQRRIIPAGEPRHRCRRPRVPCRAQGCDHRRRSRLFGYSVVCLLPENRSLLVVDDQAWTVRLRHLNQCHTGIVRAGKPEARETTRSRRGKAFPARAPIARGRNPSRADGSQLAPWLAGEPSREVKSRRCKPGMSRTNSFVRLQAVEPCRRSDNCHPASIIIGGAQQSCFIPRNKRMLASPRAACDTAAKQIPRGRER